jgi:hypothetical protein
MNCKGFKRKGHDLIEVLSQYLPGETERNMKNLILGQDRWLAGQYLSAAPPEYMSKSVVNTPMCSVNGEIIYFPFIHIFHPPN